MNTNDYKIWGNPEKIDINILSKEKLESWNWIQTEKINYLRNWEPRIWERVVRDTTNWVIAVLPVTRDNKIVLIENVRVPMITDDFDGTMIELPAGLVDDNETKEEAVNRELKEETWFSSDNINYVDTVPSSAGMTNEEVDLYIALNCDKVTDILEHDDGETISAIYAIPFNDIDEFLEEIVKRWVKKWGKIEWALRHLERKFKDKLYN